MWVKKTKTGSSTEVFTMEYSMTTDSNGGLVIQGRSFAFPLDNVDFLTWKYNPETSHYWLKFHFESKEVRLKLTLGEVNKILKEWKGIEFNPDDYKNGDKYELDKQR